MSSSARASLSGSRSTSVSSMSIRARPGSIRPASRACPMPGSRASSAHAAHSSLRAAGTDTRNSRATSQASRSSQSHGRPEAVAVPGLRSSGRRRISSRATASLRPSSHDAAVAHWPSIPKTSSSVAPAHRPSAPDRSERIISCHAVGLARSPGPPCANNSHRESRPCVVKPVLLKSVIAHLPGGAEVAIT
jgi:hypothetical protein